MERLKLIDDIRKKALDFMKEDSSLTYDVASKNAKVQLVGSDILITEYRQPVDNQESVLEIAKKELSPNIRVNLYQEDQLREMIVANRLGVDIESFVNIFLTPEQIHFLTVASLSGKDITPYMSDVQFNPQEEMKKLEQSMNDYQLSNNEVATVKEEKGFQKIYTPNYKEAA